MDLLGAIQAVIAFLQTNWNVIEPLAVRLAADIAAAWVLLKALAKVLEPYFPAAQRLNAKLGSLK